MEIKPPEQMKNFGDYEKNAYILEFIISKRRKDIPHMKPKKCQI